MYILFSRHYCSNTMASSMSTPISQLPNNKPLSGSVPDDPEVINVLKEMEEEVQNATRINQQSVVVPSVQISPVPPPQLVYQLHQSKLVDYNALQRAAIIAVIAGVAFYPGILDNIYSMSPYLEQLANFDLIVRAVIVATIVYIMFTQFGL